MKTTGTRHLRNSNLILALKLTKLYIIIRPVDKKKNNGFELGFFSKFLDSKFFQIFLFEFFQKFRFKFESKIFFGFLIRIRIHSPDYNLNCRPVTS